MAPFREGAVFVWLRGNFVGLGCYVNYMPVVKIQKASTQLTTAPFSVTTLHNRLPSSLRSQGFECQQVLEKCNGELIVKHWQQGSVFHKTHFEVNNG